MDNKNILFLQENGGSASLASLFKNYLEPQGCHLFSVDVTFDIEETLTKIIDAIKKRDIDIIIGASLGGFYVLSMDFKGYKIALNPSLHPDKDFAGVRYKDSFAERKMKITDKTYVVQAVEDDVLNSSYKTDVKSMFSYLEEHSGRQHSFLSRQMKHQITPEFVTGGFDSLWQYIMDYDDLQAIDDALAEDDDEEYTDEDEEEILRALGLDDGDEEDDDDEEDDEEPEQASKSDNEIEVNGWWYVEDCVGQDLEGEKLNAWSHHVSLKITPQEREKIIEYIVKNQSRLISNDDIMEISRKAYYSLEDKKCTLFGKEIDGEYYDKNGSHMSPGVLNDPLVWCWMFITGDIAEEAMRRLPADVAEKLRLAEKNNYEPMWYEK